ncbi:phenylalanine--tRNA ligase alpha subunit [Agrilus planipennis]|uniref:phenylalanine--tRNA ligase n=1 Tax=Agrilus planipennis TaxID=224129 RepID=A0A1W4WER8_AGRPL|nr:phenylalanine--tRNA ligase alpha subunit [Agrilus planipennis]XP_018318495.1 phenylalanine--tRNA ligase alpha subunit [Agrilus planipennis]
MSANLCEKILQHLSDYDAVNTIALAKILQEDHQKVIGAVKSIQATGDLVTADPQSTKHLELTSEGKEIAEKGSHEAAIFNAVPEEGISQSDLMKLPNSKVGFSKAMSAGWISLDKTGTTPVVRRKTSQIHDAVQQHLKDIASGNHSGLTDNLKQEYKKRKLLQEVIVKSFDLKKGPEFNLSLTKLETDLTSDMLASGSWKTLKFKDYNLDALGAPLECGALHPLLKVRSEFRQIFLEMGFTEMPTNNFVESSFWNFDSLFQPQQHPARDAHDTFFISDPKTSSNFPKDYLEKVKKVHSKGGYGSQGYRYDWKIEEAEKNLLRTHTTAVSARMLYKLAREKEFRPVKFFSIDRVFRNETLDATHLAEFHQVEGVVADYNLNLGNLIGVLSEFFKKLGITDLEFKPAYNPYTEPSMEIFCFHKGLNKWIEIGNSGLFRPEMLLPMGLPDNVNVIAWGLSLERPTMIKYGYNNIRDLVGPRVDLQMVQSAPICRLDK